MSRDSMPNEEVLALSILLTLLDEEDYCEDNLKICMHSNGVRIVKIEEDGSLETVAFVSKEIDGYNVMFQPKLEKFFDDFKMEVETRGRVSKRSKHNIDSHIRGLSRGIIISNNAVGWN